MADINHVVLVGRLTRDAELKYTSNGSAVSKFSLAINRRKKSGDQWTEEVSFFNVVVWGRVAEALNPYMLKGKQVGVQGELRQNRWEQDGQPRSRVEITAFNIQLLGGRTGTQASEPGPAANNTNSPESFPDSDFEDDIPF